MSQEYLIQAFKALQEGHLQDAQDQYLNILQSQPDQAEAYYYLGVIAHQQGQRAESLKLIEKSIKLQPNNGTFHYGKAVVLHAEGRIEEAIASYQQAILLHPTLLDSHFKLAGLYQRLNRLNEATRHYLELLQIDPNHKFSLSNLGEIAKLQGDYNQAIHYYQRALQIDPNFAEVYNNLGSLLQKVGRYQESLVIFQQGLIARSDTPQLHNGLGNALKALGHTDEAKKAYEEAIRLKPDYSTPYKNLGLLFRDSNKIEQAIDCFKKVIELNPEIVDAYICLGDTLLMRNQLDDAIANYEKALTFGPNAAIKVKLARVLPRIYQTEEEIADWRTRFTQQFNALLTEPIELQNPVSEIGAANFYLAYQGLNNRDLHKSVSKLFEKAYPWKKVDYIRNVKPRIGFFSAHFKSGHTILKFYLGILNKISREKFDVNIYNSRGEDSLPIQAEHQYTNFKTNNIDEIYNKIASDQLDLLFYPDIGMEPFSYFLAFNKLAPVQCVSWGHPDTTGISSMDYFISSKLLESENASEHYTETLVLLDDLPTYYYRPKLDDKRLKRNDFDLSDKEHIYICPQTLFKFHPEFDDLLADILRRDPHSKLILVSSHFPEWKDALLMRFQKVMPDVIHQIKIFDSLKHAEFLSLLSLADVALDTLHFGGGNTTYEALSLGLPVVTLPREFMRSRITAGCYQKIGLYDCVAATTEEYTSKALRLGTDVDYRNEIKQKILDHNSVLFEDMNAVRQLEKFFKEATEMAPARS